MTLLAQVQDLLCTGEVSPIIMQCKNHLERRIAVLRQKLKEIPRARDELIDKILFHITNSSDVFDRYGQQRIWHWRTMSHLIQISYTRWREDRLSDDERKELAKRLMYWRYTVLSTRSRHSTTRCRRPSTS